MKGMEQIIKVRKAGFKPKSVSWSDHPKAIEGWENHEANKRYCLEVRNYILDEMFFLASDGVEPVDRMDLRGLVKIEHVSIDTNISPERARALHKAAMNAGVEQVVTNFCDDRSIRLLLIRDGEHWFNGKEAQQ